MKLNSGSSYLKLQFNQMIIFFVIFLSLSSACFSCEKCEKDMSQAIAKYVDMKKTAYDLYYRNEMSKDYFIYYSGVYDGLIISQEIKEKYHSD